LQRLLTTATIVGLLIATAAAFAITERLKLTKSAVYGTIVAPPAISPVCRCDHAHATIFFDLRRADDVTVSILNGSKQEIALLAARHLPRGPVALKWNGRNDFNARVRDGTYRVRIHLANQHQTIDLPNRIRVDTTAPQILAADPNRTVFSPDHDHQADFVRITYALSKPAHLVLYLGNKQVLYSRAHAKGSVLWSGTGPNGGALPPGTYTLTVGAVDLTGNSTPAAQRERVRVEIRFIQLANTRIVARAGKAFAIGVSTDAKKYAWKLGRRHGSAFSPLLQLKAPTTKGRYTLTVTELGHTSRAAVIVR
jgi:hypothetical protein